MNLEIQLTEDGSHTVFVPRMNEHYHSTFGAVNESKHIYIDAALRQCTKSEGVVEVLEIGFGTGLNAFLAMMECEKTQQKVRFTTVELFPLAINFVEQLNFSDCFDGANNKLFLDLHRAPWGEFVDVTDLFSIRKLKMDFSLEHQKVPSSGFDVVFFDAFAPDKQPEMWSQEIFDTLRAVCNPCAVITTYCAKGSVRRMMQQAGFVIERLPGPPGKREMLRASLPTTL